MPTDFSSSVSRKHPDERGAADAKSKQRSIVGRDDNSEFVSVFQ